MSDDAESDNTNSDACPICFDEHAPDFIVLECNHTICGECYDSWHVSNKKWHCSICRQPFPESRIIPLETEERVVNTSSQSQNRRQIIESRRAEPGVNLYPFLRIILYFITAISLHHLVTKSNRKNHPVIYYISMYSSIMLYVVGIPIELYLITCADQQPPLSNSANVQQNIDVDVV